MSSTAAQLAALGNDSQFQYRVRSLILQEAAVIYGEAPATPDTRRTFARNVLANNDVAQRLAVVIANRTNLVAGATSYDFTSGHVVTDVTDAAISSQIASDWNLLAGV